MKKSIITIDGPAGSGKSTVARIVAEKLNFLYLDTGAMYRAVALYFIKNNLSHQNKSENLKSILKKINISFHYDSDQSLVKLNGEIVESEIRTPEVTDLASPLSALPEVRTRLISMQRKIGKDKNLVCEGRDMGTVVFPHADLKIFLVAHVDQRVNRRLLDLHKKGIETDFGKLKKQMEMRDYRDSHRNLSPLKPADDAIEVDTTNLSIQQVVDKIMQLYEAGLGKTP